MVCPFSKSTMPWFEEKEKVITRRRKPLRFAKGV